MAISGDKVYAQQQLEFQQERNILLRDSVDLQREHLEFSKQQAREQQKRIGEYADKILKDGLQEILRDLSDLMLEEPPTKSSAAEIARKIEILLGENKR